MKIECSSLLILEQPHISVQILASASVLHSAVVVVPVPALQTLVVMVGLIRCLMCLVSASVFELVIVPVFALHLDVVIDFLVE